MKDQIKLQLGGKERELNFSKMGFMQNLSEVQDMDPLEFLSSDPKKPKDVFTYIEKIVHAGLLTQCNIDCVKPDFDAETVNMWVKGMEFDDGAKVIRACIGDVLKVYGSQSESGEAEAQTNQVL